MANYKRDQSAPLEARLQAFYEKNGEVLRPEDDIFGYAERLGFSVWKLPLDEEKLDGIILVNKKGKKIGINDSLSLKEARFVLAHELGHYIDSLQSGEDSLIAVRDHILHGLGKCKKENDMDYMAAAMLVPKDSFLEDLKVCCFDFDKYVDKEAAELKETVPFDLMERLISKYCVHEKVITRRIVEVSYYV